MVLDSTTVHSVKMHVEGKEGDSSPARKTDHSIQLLLGSTHVSKPHCCGCVVAQELMPGRMVPLFPPFCAVHAGVPAANQALLFAGRQLAPDSALLLTDLQLDKYSLAHEVCVVLTLMDALVFWARA